MTENLNLKTVDTVDTRPFKKLVMTIGELPTSFVESMTYYELLAWFTNYLETVIIPTVNNNGEAVEELQGKFIELNTAFITLKNFVDTYFENLDVQEEINNKLDEMVEDGTLQDVLLNYATVAKVYNTTREMIADADNLVVGEKIKTLGYYNLNDGGGGDYIIVNTTSTKYQIVLGTNKYALLIATDVNVDQLGGNAGDNTLATYFDTLEDAQKVYPNALALTEKIGGVAIQCAINYFWTDTIMLGEGTYYVNKPLTNGSATTLSLIGTRKRRVTIKYTDVSVAENSILELGSNTHRCVIENIDFVGPYDFPAVEDITQQLLESYNTNGIYLNHSTDNIIKNCTFDRCKSGVKASYSWCDTIESCWFIRNNIGYDSGSQSGNNALRLESCIIEYNNYGAWIGEGRSQLVLNCDIERNILHGLRKSNEGDIQIISTYFENDFVCYVDTTYTRNILFSGCSFYQNSNKKAFYVPITYDGEDDVTQVTVMNCNFIDGKSDVDFSSHYAIREYSGTGIKPVLMNNTTTRIKEFNPSGMRGISVNNGLLREYRKRSFAVNNINASDAGTTTFDLVNGDDWRVNIPTSGTHSFKLPTVDTPDIYVNHNFKFIIPAGNSTRTGTISVIPDDSSTCDVEGHTTITATDSAKMITATFIGNYSSKSHWCVTVSA